jgi:RNA polymerase sigma-70 factor, ECF subfamily
VNRVNEHQLLEAARAGDESAFARLVEPHRGALHAHCYRMLASVHDAEDALQETLLAAWRGIGGFKGRSSLRPWLYSIATNVCLRALEREPKRVLPTDYAPAADPHDGPGEPLVESVWVEPYPERPGVGEGLASPEARYEQRESVELAFIAALQHLPARQRAVLILRDVLGFSARETAEALETTPTAVDSALQRAHKTVDERLPERSQQEVLSSLDDQRLREIVEGYVDAWERADVDAVVAMLTDEAAFNMPPPAHLVQGSRRGRRLHARLAPLGGGALAHGSCPRERPTGVRPLRLERGDRDLHPARHHGAHPRGRSNRRDHELRRARALRIVT